MLARCSHLACQRIDLPDALDLITEHLQPYGFLSAGRIYVYDISSCTERAALEVYVIPRILYLSQPAQELHSLDLHTGSQADQLIAVGRR